MRWALDHWYLPFLVVGAVVLFILTRGKSTGPSARVAREMSAIRAKRDIRNIRINEGADAAKSAVRADYADKIAKLEATKDERITALEDNPEALAKLLEGLDI